MGSGWGMGSIGGWLSNANFPDTTTVSSTGQRSPGGLLSGTGAGFSTWWNTPKADVVPGVSVGSGIGRVLFKPISRTGVSLLVSPTRGWETKDNDIGAVTWRAPSPNTKELQVAAAQAKAQQAAQVRPVRFVTGRPQQAVCCC